MTNPREIPDDDLEIVDPQDLHEALVLESEEHRHEYLRTQWIGDIILQLIEERVNQGLTQNELGQRMGKPQSSVARLERGEDIKLSTLWEYLAAMGKTPSGRLPVTSLEAEEDRLSKFVVGSSRPNVAPILRAKHWKTRPLSPSKEEHAADYDSASHRARSVTNEDNAEPEAGEVAVA